MGGGPRGGNIPIHIAYSLHCAAETNIVKQLSPVTKKKSCPLDSGARFTIEKEWLLTQASKDNLKLLLVGTLCLQSIRVSEADSSVHVGCGYTFPPFLFELQLLPKSIHFQAVLAT